MDYTHTTSMGTPRAGIWDDEWAARVEARETELGRRICGAKTLADTPCTLTSDHKTGRCAHHGGTDAIGAPVGNSNARIHGLYARRLQRCGTHCPMWDHCPFAKPEVLALDPKERPNCAYETEEYDRIIASLDAEPAKGGPSSSRTCAASAGLAGCAVLTRPRWNLALPGGFEELQIHNLALLQVMVSRAAAALSVTQLTDTVTSESDRYRLESTKVHAALEAFLRLSREHRATLKDFDQTGGPSASRTCAASAGLAGRPANPELSVENAEILSKFTHTNPNANSYAEFIQPLIEAGEGIMEEAIAAETDRVNYTRGLEAVLQKQFGDNWREKLEPTAQPP